MARSPTVARTGPGPAVRFVVTSPQCLVIIAVGGTVAYFGNPGLKGGAAVAIGALVGQRLQRWKHPPSTEIPASSVAVAKRSRLARFGIASGIFVAVVGAGFSVTGLMHYEKEKPPPAQSAHAAAVVTSAAIKGSTCANVATFSVDGHQHDASPRSPLGYCHYAVGDRVSVDYDPSDPTAATTVLPTSLTLGQAEIGLVIALAGVAISSSVLVGSTKIPTPKL
jgi:hypothetical protein